MDAYSLYFDGACEPKNPGGIGTWGFVLLRGKEVIAQEYGNIGEGEGVTNNVAEYNAMLMGLQLARDTLKSGDKLVVYGDSQLAIKQMNGRYNVNSDRIRHFYKLATSMAKVVKQNGVSVSFEWIPREQNEKADELSHTAFVEYCAAHGRDYHPCTCGGTLVKRTNRKTGGSFYGCSRYPKCKKTKEVEVACPSSE